MEGIYAEECHGQIYHLGRHVVRREGIILGLMFVPIQQWWGQDRGTPALGNPRNMYCDRSHGDQ